MTLSSSFIGLIVPVFNIYSTSTPAFSPFLLLLSISHLVPYEITFLALDRPTFSKDYYRVRTLISVIIGWDHH